VKQVAPGNLDMEKRMKEFNDLMMGMNKIVNTANKKKTKGRPKDSSKDAYKK